MGVTAATQAATLLNQDSGQMVAFTVLCSVQQRQGMFYKPFVFSCALVDGHKYMPIKLMA